MHYIFVPVTGDGQNRPCKETKAESRRPADRRGMVLVAVLIITVLLSLAAYQYADLMTAEYKASSNGIRLAQARAAAESGIMYVAAILADAGNMESMLNGNPFDCPTAFQGIMVLQGDGPRGSVRFSIVSPRELDPAGADGPRFGVTDEAGRINLNAMMKVDPTGKALYNMLVLLPNMTQDIANSIVFWLDPAATPRTSADGGLGSADNSYYSSLTPSYVARNGPIESIEELLLVRDVWPELLFGGDVNRNGVQDQGEPTGPEGEFDRGWSDYLTIYSREANKDSTGLPKLNLNQPNADTTDAAGNTIPGVDLMTQYGNLAGVVSDDMAKYIMLARLYGTAAVTTTATASINLTSGSMTVVANQTTNTQTSTSTYGSLSGLDISTLDLENATPSKAIASLYDLIGTQVTVPATGQGGQATIYLSPLTVEEGLDDVFPLLFEKGSLNADLEIPGRINVNTAPDAVIRTLPGLTEAQIEEILGARPPLSATEAPDPIFQTPAWLMTEAGIPPATMKTLEKYITARTQVYRFQVLGYSDGEASSPAERIEAVVDINGGMPRILYRRPILTEFGTGFTMAK